MKTNLLIVFVLSMLFSCSNKEEIPSQKTKENLKPIVFITGIDKGDNKFYTNAKNYFTNKNYIIVDNTFSLSSILNWLNTHYSEGIYTDIHIVSHSNSWRGMSLTTTKNGERINQNTLQKAIDNEQITRLTANLSKTSKIIFHSCGLGNNTVLLASLKNVFKSNHIPKVYASKYYNVFNKNMQYLAKTYYVYYPTAHSTGKLDLSKELKAKYPKTSINWLATLHKYKNSNLSKKESFSYKFNIPLEWEFEFTSKNDIPKLKTADDIMDFVSDNDEIALGIYKLEIPLEKFRWKSKIKDKKLTLYGKTTVVFILQPLIDDKNNYQKLNLLNIDQYLSL